MGKEFRRKAPRRDFSGEIGLLFKGKLISSYCQQVGEGGALVRATAETSNIQVGHQFVTTIFFPDIGGICSTAKCLYKGESGDFGISFNELDMQFKKRVREYVSRRKL